jgi:hypothetical protein
LPLQSGKSQEIISHNIKEMVEAGHPQKQAVAAALSKSRENDNESIHQVYWQHHLDSFERSK